jgi:hypothetical protein
MAVLRFQLPPRLLVLPRTRSRLDSHRPPTPRREAGKALLGDRNHRHGDADGNVTASVHCCGRVCAVQVRVGRRNPAIGPRRRGKGASTQEPSSPRWTEYSYNTPSRCTCAEWVASDGFEVRKGVVPLSSLASKPFEAGLSLRHLRQPPSQAHPSPSKPCVAEVTRPSRCNHNDALAPNCRSGVCHRVGARNCRAPELGHSKPCGCTSTHRALQSA